MTIAGARTKHDYVLSVAGSGCDEFRGDERDDVLQRATFTVEANHM